MNEFWSNVSKSINYKYLKAKNNNNNWLGMDLLHFIRMHWCVIKNQNMLDLVNDQVNKARCDRFFFLACQRRVTGSHHIHVWAVGIIFIKKWNLPLSMTNKRSKLWGLRVLHMEINWAKLWPCLRSHKVWRFAPPILVTKKFHFDVSLMTLRKTMYNFQTTAQTLANFLKTRMIFLG